MSLKEILMNKSVKKHRTLIKEFIAEFMGTFTLLTIGNSVIAASLLKGKIPEPFSVCFAYGVGAMIAILGCGHLSGAHINPAATLAQAVVNNFPWRKVWYYLTAQYLAGFVSSAVIYVVYYDAFNNFKHKDLDPASVFTTFPFEDVTIRGVIIDQIIGTAMLFFSISAIGNRKGFSVPNSLQAPMICLLITACCLSFGLNAGAIFNPARDFAPRLFALIIFGPRVFNPLNYHYWWAAGIVGPHIGAILGVFLFKISCDYYSEEQKKEKPKQSYAIEDSIKRINQPTVSIC